MVPSYVREQQRRRYCLEAAWVYGLLQGVHREIENDGRHLGHAADDTDAVVPGNARNATEPLWPAATRIEAGLLTPFSP